MPDAVTASSRNAASATDSRIAALRQAMSRHGVDACIVPSSDPHLSEYLPGRWQGRTWLSGFTGSVGTLVVTADFAGLWVDSRYWVQAEAQLAGTCVQLMKIAVVTAPGHVEWLARHVRRGGVVAVDGQVLSVSAYNALRVALDAAGVRLETELDLLGEIWKDRPGLPQGPVYEHLPPHACVTRVDKLAQIRAAMRDRGAQAHFISTLDDVAWLLNLRGSDVDYNPVFVAHLLVRPDDAILFVADGKIDAALREVLAADGVQLRPYADAAGTLRGLDGAAVMLDPGRVTHGMRQALAQGARAIETVNPSTLAKARKTAAELEHVRAVMEQDGAALCEFFSWFEQALGHEAITEQTVHEKLSAERARRPGFVSLSFGTIAAYNANGAMPHYRVAPETAAEIAGEGLLLIDSGGQYLGGTTDITRVVPIGRASAEQKRDFTVVLKGMIALSRARFPRGVLAPMLDAIARGPIWDDGADYGHGTGHGVGYFMNVHEPPQVISFRAPALPAMAMEPGMITSNEPGIYRPGRWGVRIENLVCCQPWRTTELGEFMGFETLTLCPIDTRCVDLSLMRTDEIAWLNRYHEEVRRRLAPLVEGRARAWLQERTQPLD